MLRSPYRDTLSHRGPVRAYEGTMQDVDRGIVIPIDCQPALRTPMHANTQFFGNQRSAVRADLAGMTRIDCDHLRTGTFSLEREMSQKLGPTRIMNAFSYPGAAETIDIQVFDRNQRELVDQPPAELMREIFPLVGDSAVGLGHLAPGPVPTARELLPAGEATLLLPEFSFGLSEVTGGRNQLSGRKGCQGSDAKVHANRISLMGLRLGIGNLELEGGKTLSQAIMSDDHGLDLGLFRDRAVKEGANLSHVLNAEASVLETGPISKAELQRAEARSWFEPGKARLLTCLDTTKEGRKGLLQPAKDLLARREIELAQAFEIVGADLFELIGLRGIVQRDSGHPPGFYPLFQGGIVKPAALFKNMIQGLDLSLTWIEAVLV